MELANYYLPKNYRSRKNPQSSNRLRPSLKYQKEVYQYGLRLCAEYKFSSVLDIGCGTAAKLLKYFGHLDTLGTDTKYYYDWLNKHYPEKKWAISDFDVVPVGPFNLVICADVVEHLVEPDNLLKFVSNIDWNYFIISTPNRDEYYSRYRKKGIDGPPHNKKHVREWNNDEFIKYISDYFSVVYNEVCVLPFCTQFLVCKKYDIK